MVKNGWFGIVLLEFFGGFGLGIFEVIMMMQIIVEFGVGMVGVQSIYVNVYVIQLLVKFGSIV